MTLFIGRIGRAAPAFFVCTAALLATALVPECANAQSRDGAVVVAVPDVYPGTEGVGFILRSADPRRPDSHRPGRRLHLPGEGGFVLQ